MPIIGREARFYPSPAMPNFVQEIFTISEDGNSITSKRQTADGSTYTYSRQ
jgi:hypothetical protein